MSAAARGLNLPRTPDQTRLPRIRHGLSGAASVWEVQDRRGMHQCRAQTRIFGVREAMATRTSVPIRRSRLHLAPLSGAIVRATGARARCRLSLPNLTPAAPGVQAPRKSFVVRCGDVFATNADCAPAAEHRGEATAVAPAQLPRADDPAVFNPLLLAAPEFFEPDRPALDDSSSFCSDREDSRLTRMWFSTSSTPMTSSATSSM